MEEIKKAVEDKISRWYSGRGISESDKGAVVDFLFTAVYNLSIDVENLKKGGKYGEV